MQTTRLNLGLLAVSVVLTLTARADSLYVDASCTNPAPPYATWETAATNIQDAVALAVDGDTVLVTNGIYSTATPILGSGSNVVHITNGIALRAVNGPAATIISGQGLYRCVFMQHSAAELDGFTLALGTSNGSTEGGGGALVTDGLVTNCVFAGNIATNRPGNGGGLYGVRTTVANCVFSNNAARYFGGGVFLNSGALRDCVAVSNTAFQAGGGFSCRGTSRVERCHIEGNTAAEDVGGGIYIRDRGLVSNCVIAGNSGYSSGGGLFAQGSSTATTLVQACTVRDNTTAGNGGGVYIQLNARLEASEVYDNSATDPGGGVGASDGTLSNLFIHGNTSASDGGGIYGSCDVLNCVISNNASGNRGGGAYIEWDYQVSRSYISGNRATNLAGGLYLQSNARALASVVERNTAPTGGGVSGWGLLELCTVAENTAAAGGGVAQDGTPALSVNHSIVYHNHAAAGSNHAGVFPAVNYSCLAPDPGAGSGNIATDPQFLDAAAGDFRLPGGSACIDAGSSTNTARDFAGMPRPLDGDAMAGAAHDMGAYELLNPLGDSDGDGARDGDEQRAGTDLVDPLSVFEVASAVTEGGGIVIRWSSVDGKVYGLGRATNIFATYETLATNLAASPPVNVYTDTTATAEANYYQVRVAP